jgi:alcohol dehydrogenase
MKAMLLERYGEPLVPVERADPVPGYGEVLIAVRRCGICGTDLKITSGALDGITSVPLIPGHEMAGEVVEVGPGASRELLGTRCGVYFYLPCGDCPECRRGHENVCRTIRRLGFEKDGGYAECVVVPAYGVCPIKESVSFSVAAVATDAILTPYHALYSVAAVRPQERVLILGAGGLGLHGVQLAALAGARVAVCDIRPASLEAARKAGAEAAFAPEELTDGMAEWTRGAGAEVVIDGVGKSELTAESFKSLGRRGRLVVMGYDPKATVPLPALGAHYNEWQVFGTRLGTKEELLGIYDLLARGKITAAVALERPLSEANEALAALRAGGPPGRTVLQVS